VPRRGRCGDGVREDGDDRRARFVRERKERCARGLSEGAVRALGWHGPRGGRKGREERETGRARAGPREKREKREARG
jgi:hypothetical protein